METKPVYCEMIIDAIQSLNEKSGSSVIAILKYLDGKYPSVQPITVKAHLKKLVDINELLKVKRSYKLSPKLKRRLKKQNRHLSLDKNGDIEDEEEEFTIPESNSRKNTL